MSIIDFRLRPPLKGFLDMIMYADAERRDRITRQHGMEPAPSAGARSMELLISEMVAAGVTTGVVMGRYSDLYGSVSNQDVADIVTAYPGRFIGIGSVDPSNRKNAIKQIDEALALGLKGINLEPGAYPVPMYADDRRLYPIYAYCEDKGIPVVVMAGGGAGPDLSYTFPVHIDRVAGDFPGLRIAISHGGWPWVQEILHVAFRRPNVYVSPDQYLCNMAGTDDYVKAANGFLSERFLYASSYPFVSVKQYADWFRHLPIKPELMERLMYRNAAEFLGLTA
ncbi:MAG: amidohydrolase [Betaproteobacteria bacterium RIFCSPLOWO2_12_FULL_62_13]|nr:MAG: amidohydrolase [Betaproteobacteria bacterium RIFCSPLOWO2_12_FULL_62_13]